jgi:hypothetical protein
MTCCRQIRPGSRLWDVIAIAAVDAQAGSQPNKFSVSRFPTHRSRSPYLERPIRERQIHFVY